MLKEFRALFEPFSFVSPKDMAALIQIASVVRFNKGDQLIRAGEKDYRAYMLLHGISRTYVVREDGEEITTYLATPGMSIGSSKTIFGGEVGNENVVALENLVCVCVDFREFDELKSRNHNINRLYSKAMEKNLKEAVERLELHVVMTPEQRYLFLLQHRPEILNRVPLKYIASYIGITPVSLSRMRARLVK